MQIADHYAELTVDVRVDGHQLTVHYAVRNKGDVPLYLFNLLHHGWQGGGYHVDRNLAVVEWLDGGVTVAKALTPVPASLLVEVPNIPCMTLLAARASFAESFVLPLPLVAWTPYSHGRGGAARRLPLRFALGYAVGGTDPRGAPKTVPTTIGPALQFNAFSESSQMILSVGPFEPVPAYEPMPDDA